MSDLAFPKWASAPPSWITTPGQDLNGVVISSRARLARNLAGTPFPHNAHPSTQKKVIKLVLEAAAKAPDLKSSHSFHLSDLSSLEKNFLMERHLISHQHAKEVGEKGLIVGTGESLSIMINEEDHIRAAAFEAGLALTKAWASLSSLESNLGGALQFSFDAEFGFITACPTNVGSGLRASCLVHLPALTQTGKIQQLILECSRNNLILRGFYGEGTRPLGHIYQISNSQTLGISENETVRKVEKIVQMIAMEEKKAQGLLLTTKHRMQTEDAVNRSIGTLSSARLLNFNEGMQLISQIRMGLMLGMKVNLTMEETTNLIFLMQPAHLRCRYEQKSGEFSDEATRARLIRQKISG